MELESETPLTHSETQIIHMNENAVDLSYLDKPVPSKTKGGKKRKTVEPESSKRQKAVESNEEEEQEGLNENEGSIFTLPTNNECMEIAIRIKRYREHSVFGPICHTVIPTYDLASKTKDQLEEICAKVECAIGARRTSGSTKSMIAMGINAWEMALNKYTPIKATGVSQALSPYSAEDIKAMTNEFPLICDELAIKYDKAFYTDPLMAAGQCVLQTTLGVHTAHRAAEKQAANQTPSVTSEERTRFSEI